jgi:hypothetical protein
MGIGNPPVAKIRGETVAPAAARAKQGKPSPLSHVRMARKEVLPERLFRLYCGRPSYSEVTDMGAPGRAPAIKAEVVSDPTVMSGDPS